MKALITNEAIAKLDPCDGRHDNYLAHYKGKAHTKGQFMGLRHITQADKLWVAFKLMPKHLVRLAAADIAESVLPIYEAEYPGDDRPRKAIEAARTGDQAAVAAAAHAAHAATAATSAASANAAYSAAAAAHAAAAASANAAHATAINAASHASSAAYATYAASGGLAQEKLIRKIVLKYWSNL